MTRKFPVVFPFFLSILILHFSIVWENTLSWDSFWILRGIFRVYVLLLLSIPRLGLRQVRGLLLFGRAFVALCISSFVICMVWISVLCTIWGLGGCFVKRPSTILSGISILVVLFLVLVDFWTFFPWLSDMVSPMSRFPNGCRVTSNNVLSTIWSFSQVGVLLFWLPIVRLCTFQLLPFSFCAGISSLSDYWFFWALLFLLSTRTLFFDVLPYVFALLYRILPLLRF